MNPSKQRVTCAASTRGRVQEFHDGKTAAISAPALLLEAGDAGHGSLRCATAPLARFFTVYWSAALEACPAPAQSIGVDTAAPGRARVE